MKFRQLVEEKPEVFLTSSLIIFVGAGVGSYKISESENCEFPSLSVSCIFIVILVLVSVLSLSVFIYSVKVSFFTKRDLKQFLVNARKRIGIIVFVVIPVLLALNIIQFWLHKESNRALKESINPPPKEPEEAKGFVDFDQQDTIVKEIEHEEENDQNTNDENRIGNQRQKQDIKDIRKLLDND